MKKLIKAKKVTIEQAWIKLHKLELEMDVSEIWLKVNMVLNKDNNAPMDYFNEELINQSDVVLKDTPITYEDKDWVFKSFNKYSLATFIADTVFSTFDSLSSKWIESFKAYIDEAKDILREYEKKNWQVIDKVKTLEEVITKKEVSNDEILLACKEILDAVNNIEIQAPVLENKTIKPRKQNVVEEVQEPIDTTEMEDAPKLNIWWMSFNVKKIRPWEKIRK